MTYDDYHHSEIVYEKREAYLEDFKAELEKNLYKPPKSFMKTTYYSYAVKSLMDNGTFTELSKKYDINRKKIFSHIITDYATFGTILGRKKILNHPLVESHSKKGPFVKIKSEFGDFEFRPILDYFLDESIIPLPQLSSLDRLKLYSGLNIRHCHTISLEMCDENYDVVTGLVNDYLNGCQMCHSWIEFIKNNEVYVLDFCFNLMMKQEDYYNLFDVDVYSKINKQTLTEDIAFLSSLSQEEMECISIEDYLMEREKSLTLLQKNHCH